MIIATGLHNRTNEDAPDKSKKKWKKKKKK